MKTKILSLALALVLILALIPAAFAAGTTETFTVFSIDNKLGDITVTNVTAVKDGMTEMVNNVQLSIAEGLGGGVVGDGDIVLLAYRDRICYVEKTYYVAGTTAITYTAIDEKP
ncbi:MAG: hypothetical protein FWG72_11095, partial [Oscillospiraceae bacterium]|nr:hypothetical protein [Oscillospiraceae bacterium]